MGLRDVVQVLDPDGEGVRLGAVRRRLPVLGGRGHIGDVCAVVFLSQRLEVEVQLSLIQHGAEVPCVWHRAREGWDWADGTLATHSHNNCPAAGVRPPARAGRRRRNPQA